MRSWKRYPKYKDSGVEWLGEIPEGWDRDVFSRNAFYQEGPGLRNWQFTDEGIRVICVTNITDKGIDFSQYEKFISDEEYYNHYSHFTVQNGDLLLSSSGNSWGKIAEYSSAEKVILNTSTIRINETQIRPLIRSFLKFILQSDSTREQLLLLMTGSCQPNFGPSHLSKLLIPIPNIPEQTAIASFLDRETTRIDALIEKKQRQIELLQEKRAALISQAVTKGLDPTVPMKDSGVPWLGEVPEHWKVSQLGRFFTLQRGFDITKDNQIEGDIPVISSGGISSYHNTSMAKGPGVLVGRKGTAGSIYFIESDYWAHDTTLWVSNFRQNCEKFVFYLLHILDLKGFDTGTANPTINRNVIHPLIIGMPPYQEQLNIVSFLEREHCKIEKTIDLIQISIKTHQEYRSALISAAVTGKIDVRETIPTRSEAQS